MEALDGVTFIDNDVELLKGESNVQVTTPTCPPPACSPLSLSHSPRVSSASSVP
jgi:hypothetical protein